MNPQKIAIIVNKQWEVEPLLSAMTTVDIQGKIGFPSVLNSPKKQDYQMKEPRAVFNPSSSIEVKVWCIKDLMYFGIPPDRNQSGSNSEEKFRVLEILFKEIECDQVISVGTAGYIGETSYNGSVVIGANFFIHNGNPNNQGSKLDRPEFGQVLSGNTPKKVFDSIAKGKVPAESLFLPVPRNPARKAVCMASWVHTNLSSVNVTDYAEYNWVDHEAIEHFREVEKRLPISSIETTHGVVRIATNKPTIFVSPITDRLGHFDAEVNLGQNFIACYNAGIVLGHLVGNWVQ